MFGYLQAHAFTPIYEQYYGVQLPFAVNSRYVSQADKWIVRATPSKSDEAYLARSSHGLEWEVPHKKKI